MLKAVEPLWPKTMRQRAVDRCVDFVTERLNGEDGLGAIYPAMANAVMMFDALGYPADHPSYATARRSIEKLLVIRDNEAYCQPCVSPVWDTALAIQALLEVQEGETDAAALRGLGWLKPLQELDVKGDWSERRPEVRPGGWAFQYRNAHYPDLDDTAVVVMAMDRARRQSGERRGGAGPGYDEAIARGVEWITGLQSGNGGWAAFDADNVDHYLNNIPFADHGALLDPPTADVSARCISMLVQLGETPANPVLRAGLDYLEREQMPDGSWFGRWGVNYIYGTWSALCALGAAGLDGTTPSVTKAAEWLIAIQNADGGWGEDCTSYKLDYRGYEPAASTASQTAWAVLGLMAAGEVEHAAVGRGIAWLRQHQDANGLWRQDAYTGGGFPRVFYLRYHVNYLLGLMAAGEVDITPSAAASPLRQHQDASGLWRQDAYTGGGFPRVFYLRYHGYPAYFPLWALARYRNLRRANSRRVAYGM